MTRVGADVRVAGIVTHIARQTQSLVKSLAFREWMAAQSFHMGDLAVFNNSLFLREDTSTTRGTLYLAVPATVKGRFGPPVIVKPPRQLNARFTRLARQQVRPHQITDIKTSVIDQLQHLGSIVFCLVGTWGDVEPAQVEIADIPGWDILRYEPTQATPVEMTAAVISLRAITDVDTAWREVCEKAVAKEIPVAAYGEAFQRAFRGVQESAARPVNLANITRDGPSILGDMRFRMKTQKEQFAAALQRSVDESGDVDSYNEVLRIAYNFADAARGFIQLMVGLCDLKPIVLWLTVPEQIDLALRLEKLPLSVAGKGKPSVGQYRSVIADARNQAFHDLFAFDHPFRVTLSVDAFQRAELRLFRGYNKRADHALTFEDRALVELLESLTRTSNRPVPKGFWEGNAEVMGAIVEVVNSLHQSLVMLAP